MPLGDDGPGRGRRVASKLGGAVGIPSANWVQLLTPSDAESSDATETPTAERPGSPRTERETVSHEGTDRSPAPGGTATASLPVTRRTVVGGAVATLLGAMPAVLANDSAADSYTAVTDGPWSDPATWESGTVPTDGADVFVQDGVTVTVTQQTRTRVKLLEVAGTLRHATDTDTGLRAETIYTRQGSRYEVGTAADPVQPEATATVEFIDEGPIDETEWPDRKNKGLIAHGAVEIAGAEKTPWTTLAQPPAAGDDTLELTGEPTNWTTGDTLIVPGTDPYESAALDHTDERRTIASVDGTTLTLESSLDHDHAPPRSDLDSYVLNLSRNVVFASETTDEHRRGHIMIMSTGSDVRYVRLDELGRTNKDEYLTNPVRGEDALPEQDDPNPSARYPFHYHKTGIGVEPHYAEGLVVDGSPGWGVVNHHAHAHVTDSVTYDVLGAGFVAEGGNERGSFKRNFALRSEGSGEAMDVRAAGAHGGDPPIDDFGHAGHGFWLQSPLVEVVDNVAAGHRLQAFVWWLRPLLDGHLAEGTSIVDSRVTFHSNLPWEYCNTDRPLFDAIEQDRFANGRNNGEMRDTEKIPSTFAEVGAIRGNEAFASAGGADFSRHNFKWKHERFSDFSAIEEITVHSIGPFIDEDGDVHEPDLPKNRAAGHQGRGGNVGVSFRYASNVSLRRSEILGSGRDQSVGVPFHDYLWTMTVEDSTVENWDWGVDTGEHRLTWIRNNTFCNNTYDVNWSFDNVGPAILEDNDLDTARHKFQRLDQKASEVFEFDRYRGMRIGTRSAHVEASDPSYVPFPDEDSLSNVNNLDDVFPNSEATVGMTNAELVDEYGVAISGRLLPDDAVGESSVEGSLLDPAEPRDPPTSVYLDSTDVHSLGAFEVVSESDVAGGECLRCTGSSTPKADPASVSFECAAGTYTVHGRIRPDTWNGDSVYYRIDGGTWREAEKIKSPVGFEWHDASPNGGDPYEWDLSEGTHTLEFACGNDGVLVDEVCLTSDGNVLGAYGLSQKVDGSVEPEPTTQEPYTDHDLAQVEAEDLDTDVDIQQTEDSSGEYNVGWTSEGEW